MQDDVVNRGVSIKLLKQYGLTLKKSLGQNLLVDGNIRNKIIQGAQICPDDVVLEIGPGIGSLTEELARQAKEVIAVEIDDQLARILQERLPHVQVIHGDILKTNLEELIPSKDVKVVANLPYYITSPVIFHLLAWGKWKNIVIMIQKEVAQRLLAKPGTKDYGAITVAVNYHAQVELVCNVPKTVFVPAPNVDSAVIRLIPQEQTWNIKDEKLFFALVKAAFGQRRKTLHNTIANAPWNKTSKEETGQIIRGAGIDPQIRGESLSVDEFIQLSNCFGEYLEASLQE